MPRIRSIKPTFARSRSVKKLTDKQKLVWICLWPVADDYGRLLDEPGQLVGDLWALSLTEAKLDALLTDLHNAGRLIRYVVAGESYIQITNWSEHQKISHPTDSGIPPVPLRNVSGVAREDSGLEGRGKEGIGGGAETEPPLKCSKHINTPEPPPCGNCADARRAHDAWALAQKNKPTISGIITDPDCEVHLGYPKRDCPRCAEEAVAS